MWQPGHVLEPSRPRGFRRPAERVARFVLHALAWPALIGAAAMLAAVGLGGDGSVVEVLLAALAAWTPLLAAGALVAFGLLGLRRGLVSALVVLVVAVALVRPYPHGNGPADLAGPRLTVMTQNLLYGQADPDVVIAGVREARPDVLVTTELSKYAVERLDDAGLRELMPYRYLLQDYGADGTGLYSTHPLTDPVEITGTRFRAAQARIVLDGHPVTVVAAHPVTPLGPDGLWSRDLARFREVIAPQLARGETVVVAGDFNATTGNAPLRRLLDVGLVDAGTAAGWSWQRPTWPTHAHGGGLDGTRFARIVDLMPPLIRIDHVLVPPGSRIDSIATRHVPGTDHLGLVARLRLPPPAGVS